MVVGDPARTDPMLHAGKIPCPNCQGLLRPHGHARTRTVRGLGTTQVKVTPRRGRCGDCGTTQVLLPAGFIPRLSDTTEVVGNALIRKTAGQGYRAIALALNRPVSTVRRWLRRVGGDHPDTLYRHGVDAAYVIDRDLLTRPVVHRTVLGVGLNLLAGAALAYRQRLTLPDSVWTLIGILARGRLLAPTRRTTVTGPAVPFHA